MITKHADDDEIQRYVLRETLDVEDIMIHIAGCETCLAKAATYSLLVNSIDELPKEAFDFDVTKLVLTQLPVKRQSIWRKDAVIYSMVCAAFSMLVVLSWDMWKGLVNIFKTAASGSLYVFIVFIVCVFVWIAYDMLVRYQKQMAALQ